MQSTRNRAAKNASGPFNSTRCRRILVQRQVRRRINAAGILRRFKTAAHPLPAPEPVALSIEFYELLSSAMQNEVLPAIIESLSEIVLKSRNPISALCPTSSRIGND
jgi:hypothetical protein